MEWLQGILEAILGSNFAWGAVIVLILAKIVPNEKIGNFAEGLGNTCTLGLSKYSWYKKVELWFIDGLAVFSTRFIKGLRSDN